MAESRLLGYSEKPSLLRTPRILKFGAESLLILKTALSSGSLIPAKLIPRQKFLAQNS